MCFWPKNTKPARRGLVKKYCEIFFSSLWHYLLSLFLIGISDKRFILSNWIPTSGSMACKKGEHQEEITGHTKFRTIKHFIHTITSQISVRRAKVVGDHNDSICHPVVSPLTRPCGHPTSARAHQLLREHPIWRRMLMALLIMQMFKNIILPIAILQFLCK